MHDNKETELTVTEKIDILTWAWVTYVKEIREARRLEAMDAEICLNFKYVSFIKTCAASARLLDIIVDLFDIGATLHQNLVWTGNLNLTLFGMFKFSELTRKPDDDSMWVRYRNSPRYKRILTTALESAKWGS